VPSCTLQKYPGGDNLKQGLRDDLVVLSCTFQKYPTGDNLKGGLREDPDIVRVSLEKLGGALQLCCILSSKRSPSMAHTNRTPKRFLSIQITMEMFFRDMRCAGLDSPRRQLRFKIDHPLCHYRKEYSHEDPLHFVVIQFSSGLDVDRVKQKVSQGLLFQPFFQRV